MSLLDKYGDFLSKVVQLSLEKETAFLKDVREITNTLALSQLQDFELVVSDHLTLSWFNKRIYVRFTKEGQVIFKPLIEAPIKVRRLAMIHFEQFMDKCVESLKDFI